jgi:hypothetical protein
MLKHSLLTCLSFCCALLLQAQRPQSYVPSNDWNIGQLYTGDSIFHTALKPVLLTDTTAQKTEGAFLRRKIFQEHHVAVQKDGFNFYADFMPDFQVGRSSRGNKTVTLNTRGVRLSGNVGNKVYFEAEDYENLAKFGGYIDSFVRYSQVVPGQGATHNRDNTAASQDYNYASGRVVYMPSSLLEFDLGYNKNFIGDGFRSLLLSDWSFNNPYLRATVKWKRFQYSVIWNNYIGYFINDPNNVLYNPRKWGQTFFLDYQVAPGTNIGLFESVMWPGQTEKYQSDLNWTVASPVMFLHGNSSNSGVPNNTLTGLNVKVSVAPRTFAYSQFAISQFLRNSSWNNRFAYQLGVRSFDVGGIKGLNLLAEYNLAKPFMYSSGSRLTNYTHYNQPLAHPLGAGFKELLFSGSYQWRNLQLNLEAFYATYRADATVADNAGHDIFKTNGGTQNVYATRLWWTSARAAYILNRKNNLRVEAGFTFRRESSDAVLFTDKIFSVGLRSSFRRILYDF